MGNKCQIRSTSKMRFLVTRPHPDCRSTAGKLKGMRQEADEAPMLVLEPLPLPDIRPDRLAAVAFTSRRAVEALAGHGRIGDFYKLPAYTVGGRTTEACRQAGFQTVHSAGSDVAGLCRMIAQAPDRPSGIVLYPAAEDRAGDLGGCLAASGIACRTIPIYRMVPAGELPPVVQERLSSNSYDGVFVFSRRTAEAFADCLKRSGLDHISSSVRVYAISRQAAEPLANFADVRIAENPSEASLLDLALNGC